MLSCVCVSQCDVGDSVGAAAAAATNKQTCVWVRDTRRERQQSAHTVSLCVTQAKLLVCGGGINAGFDLSLGGRSIGNQTTHTHWTLNTEHWAHSWLWLSSACYTSNSNSNSSSRLTQSLRLLLAHTLSSQSNSHSACAWKLYNEIDYFLANLSLSLCHQLNASAKHTLKWLCSLWFSAQFSSFPCMLSYSRFQADDDEPDDVDCAAQAAKQQDDEKLSQEEKQKQRIERRTRATSEQQQQQQY